MPRANAGEGRELVKRLGKDNVLTSENVIKECTVIVRESESDATRSARSAIALAARQQQSMLGPLQSAALASPIAAVLASAAASATHPTPSPNAKAEAS